VTGAEASAAGALGGQGDTVQVVTAPLRFAHLADTHLGYEALAVLDSHGRNQRGTDTLAALQAAVDAIETWDPPLVLHAGDVAEKPQVAVRYQLEARRLLARLAGIRPDGTRRQVVVIAGNHDAPRDKRDTCWLELCADLPGVHVVTDGPRCIDFVDHAELNRVRVWAVPHDALRDRQALADVGPLDDRVNLLVTHGVASGSALFLRHIGREHAIDPTLVDQDWDYVALGHWHSGGSVDDNPRVRYSGSTETFGFGDLRDGGNRRGWCAVTLAGDTLEAEHRPVESRPFVRLGPVDGAGLDSEQLRDACNRVIDDATLEGTVAALVVTGALRSEWSLVDQQALRQRASAALHFEIVARLAAEPTVHIPRGEAALDEVIAEASTVVAASRRANAIVAAKSYLWGQHRDLAGTLSGTGEDAPDTTSSAMTGHGETSHDPTPGQVEGAPTHLVARAGQTAGGARR